MYKEVVERVMVVGVVGCVLGVGAAPPAGAVNEADGSPCEWADELEDGPLTLWWAPSDPGDWDAAVLAEVESRVAGWGVPRRLNGSRYLEFRRWLGPGSPAGAPAEPTFEIETVEGMGNGAVTRCWSWVIQVDRDRAGDPNWAPRVAGLLVHEFGHVAFQESAQIDRLHHTPRGATVPGALPPAMSTCAALEENVVGFDDEVQLARRWDRFDPLVPDGVRPATANAGFESALAHWKRSAGVLSARSDGSAFNGEWYGRWAAGAGATMSPSWATTWGGEPFSYPTARLSRPMAQLRLTVGSDPVELQLISRARGIQWAASGCEHGSQWPDGRHWNQRAWTTHWVERRSEVVVDGASLWGQYSFPDAVQPEAQRCQPSGYGYESCLWQGMDTWLGFEWRSGAGSIDLDDVYETGGVVPAS